jgi:transcriptional regulator GlxA family with amidase domain
MAQNIDRKLPVEMLVQRVAMSPRNFARVLTREMRTTLDHTVALSASTARGGRAQLLKEISTTC